MLARDASRAVRAGERAVTSQPRCIAGLEDCLRFSLRVCFHAVSLIRVSGIFFSQQQGREISCKKDVQKERDQKTIHTSVMVVPRCETDPSIFTGKWEIFYQRNLNTPDK